MGKRFYFAVVLRQKQLSAFDWLVIAVLVIVAAIVIYFLWPLIIAIIIIGAAYYIYRWYRHRL